MQTWTPEQWLLVSVAIGASALDVVLQATLLNLAEPRKIPLSSNCLSTLEREPDTHVWTVSLPHPCVPHPWIQPSANAKLGVYVLCTQHLYWITHRTSSRVM